MKSFILLLTTVLFVIGSLYLVHRKGEMETISVGGKNIKVEVADTVPEQVRGLMFRNNIPQDYGVIFIFSESDHHPVWMKNVQQPLDVIWLDKNLKIMHIENNIPPCRENPCPTYRSPSSDAMYIIEISGGWVATNEINIDSNVSADFLIK